MAVEVRMPQYGMTMHEATLCKWLKAVGDQVAEGEVIAEIETDKIDAEVEAPASGVLSEIFAEEGTTVPVLERIAMID